MILSAPARYLGRFVALGYVLMLVAVPVGLILLRTFEPGFGAFVASITTPGRDLGAAPVAAGGRDRGSAQRYLRGSHGAAAGAQAVSRQGRPAGGDRLALRGLSGHRRVALILLWGSAGILGFVEKDLGIKVIFGLPGIILASIFVTLPFVIREVEPVLHELGTDQEEAAATLGATWWQTFRRITLPSIRWGLGYGVVLTVARTLGEYGAGPDGLVEPPGSRRP